MGLKDNVKEMRVAVSGFVLDHVDREYAPGTFEPIPAEDDNEMMTYELTIPYKERRRFEDFLQKIGFPVSALKKVVSKAAVF